MRFLQVGLIAAGLIIFLSGQCPWTKKRVVVGIPARLAGILFLAPYPTAYAIGYFWRSVMPEALWPDPEDLQSWGRMVDGTVTVLCYLAAFCLLRSYAKPALSFTLNASQQGVTALSDIEDHNEKLSH